MNELYSKHISFIIENVTFSMFKTLKNKEIKEKGNFNENEKKKHKR